MPLFLPATFIDLAANASGGSVTGTTTETAYVTISIPAGAMRANGWIEVETSWTVTNSANNKTPRIRFGGAAGTVYYGPTLTTAGSVGAITRIRNRGVTNSQIGFASASLQGGNGQSAVAHVTSSVDTTAAVDLVISGQLANSAETITLESYVVRLFRKS